METFDRGAFLATAGCAAAGAACGGGGGGGGASGSGAGPTAPSALPPTYASVTDDILELLTGRPLASGRVVVPGRAAIEIRDGRYTLTPAHQLEIGSTHRDVLVEASGSVTRKTGVVVTASGLRVDLGHKRVPLDAIGDPPLYERWLATRTLPTLMRWEPTLYRGAVVFDRQLFRHDGMKPVLYDA